MGVISIESGATGTDWDADEEYVVITKQLTYLLLL